MNIGDEKDIDITFPENYAPELAGKAVVFKIKLNNLSVNELPELDDEFAKDNGFDTLDEYKADVKADLEKRKTEQRDGEVRADLMHKAIENMTVAVPEVMVKEKAEEIIRNYARNFGVTDNSIPMDKLCEMLGLNEEAMKTSIMPAAEAQVKNDLLLEAIVAAEGFAPTEEETEVVPNLMIGFGIDEVQADYVAEIKLRHLNREYILKRTGEIEQLEKDIADLNDVLAKPARIRRIIINELNDVAKKYAQPRRSEILYDLPEEESGAEEESIPDYPVTVFFTREGYLKKIPPQSLRTAGAHKLKEGDEIVRQVETRNNVEALFFTDKQQVYKVRLAELEDGKVAQMGIFVPGRLGMDEGENILAMVITGDYSGFVLFFFASGKCAKIPLSSYATKQNRRKLLKAYSDKEELAAMLHIEEETELAVFTSGGTQSNLMGLMLARDAFFARQGHSIQQDGLPGDIRKYKVLCSENAHFSVQKNMALMGLGYRSVTLVKTDEFARMDVSDLQAKIAQAQANGEQIMAIVATAGTTDAGAIDPLRDIAGIAAEHQIWLHVDAAWGGALLLSEQYRDYLDGLELVDSVTLDFHKQFFQTISCGAFLLKDARHYELMRYQAAYLNSEFDEEHGVPNLVSKSLQTTRRFDALKLWMGLEALGQKQYAAIIDHGVTMAKNVAEYVKSQPTLELVMQPQLASVLFRSRPAQMAGSDAAAIALLNQRVGDALLASGRANVGVTEHNGVTCLKLTLLNPVVTLDDVKVLLNLVERTAQELLAQ